jgi:hypothetical protein
LTMSFQCKGKGTSHKGSSSSQSDEDSAVHSAWLERVGSHDRMRMVVPRSRPFGTKNIQRCHSVDEILPKRSLNESMHSFFQNGSNERFPPARPVRSSSKRNLGDDYLSMSFDDGSKDVAIESAPKKMQMLDCERSTSPDSNYYGTGLPSATNEGSLCRRKASPLICTDQTVPPNSHIAESLRETEIKASVSAPRVDRANRRWKSGGENAFPFPAQNSPRENKVHQNECSNPPTFIDIAPGCCLRLRGAKETWACVEQDFFIPTSCFACSLDLCCIQDAEYVLCPRCRVVSPLRGSSLQSINGAGGVGLGFTIADLELLQSEIISKSNNSIHPSS